MKLKRKLLPIIGASAGIGATAVALTGCSFFIGGGGGDWVNLLERYVPKNITQHEYTKISQNQAGEMYASNLGPQESTFAQDFYWSSYNAIEKAQRGLDVNKTISDVVSYVTKSKAGAGGIYGPGVPARNMKAVKHSAKISNFELQDTKSIGEGDKKETIMLIGYTIDYSYVYNMSSASEGISAERVESGRTNLSYIPFMVRYEDPYWTLRPSEDLMVDATWIAQYPWDIRIQAQTVMTTKGQGTPYGDFNIVNTTNTDERFSSTKLGEIMEDPDAYQKLAIELQQTAYFQSWYMYWVAFNK